MNKSVTPAAPASDDPRDGQARVAGLRSVVLAGPAAGIGTGPGETKVTHAAVAGITAADARNVLAAADHRDAYDSRLSGLVTVVLVLGLCLACGGGFASSSQH